MTLLTTERSVTHHTFVIERTYPTTPERVFAAFADPAKKRRWFALSGDSHETEAFEMDFRVGGVERSRYHFKDGSPLKGATITNDSIYQDIVPNRRIVIASTMALDGKTFSASLATAEFLPAEEGTAMIFTHQGAFFEGADGPQMRQAGWQTLLEQLAKELTR